MKKIREKYWLFIIKYDGKYGTYPWFIPGRLDVASVQKFTVIWLKSQLLNIFSYRYVTNPYFDPNLVKKVNVMQKMPKTEMESVKYLAQLDPRSE